MNKHFSLYIHIPFCASKCAYCDFKSFAGKDDAIPAYFDALSREIALRAPQFKDKTVDTIFIGGGTPSYVSERYIADLLELISQKFHLSDECEISIESNPGTLTLKKCKAYKQSGINRVSLGVQSTRPSLLKLLGRTHSFDDVLQSAQAVRRAGFTNLNLDVMFGLPTQTMQDWSDTLKDILALSPEHISAYSLIIEVGTPFYARYHAALENEDDRAMYHYLCDTLRSKDYQQYEISNFALKTKECKHNLYCWDMEEYLGLGLNAHSFIGQTRFANADTLDGYITSMMQNNRAVIMEEKLDRKELIGDYIMLALRKNSGINLTDFKHCFDEDFMVLFQDEVQKFLEDELLQLKKLRLSLTKKGLDYANYVMREFL